MGTIDTIAYYERPLFKQLRQWYAGQGIEWDKLTTRQCVEQQLGADRISNKTLKSYNHHACHAAAGFQTSPYDRATIVVIDAVGEFETITIWSAEYDSQGRAKYKRLWSQRYPHSIGLFYSAITSRVGLHPLDEEYITMGMAAWGQDSWYQSMATQVIRDFERIEFNNNLHVGFDSTFLESTPTVCVVFSFVDSDVL